MLCLNISAPFAVFRTFTAASYRPTADFLTPSAAYGLLLNLAGVEMRDTKKMDVMTHIATGLPQLSLAIGMRRHPSRHSLYQQVHNYPVGSSGKEYQPGCKGNKYNISPARRAFLSGFAACLAVRADLSFLESIRLRLRGGGPTRYGLPFLGDNNFLIDRIDVRDTPDAAYWYVPLTEEEADADTTRRSVTRLTISIDRADSSRTRSALFAPQSEPGTCIPDNAWVAVGY